MFFSRKRRVLAELEHKFGAVKTEGFNFDLIKRYFQYKDHSSANQLLSDQICNDLDFDLFFGFVDRTTSRIGQQFLYSELRSTNHIQKNREQVIQHFKNESKDRLEIQYELQRLNHHQAYFCSDLFLQQQDKKPNWYFLIPLLSFSTLLSLILIPFNSVFGFVFLSLFACNMLLHFGLKRQTTLFIHSVPTILSLGAIAQKLYKREFLKVLLPDLNNELVTISKIRRKMSFFKLEQKVDSEMEAAYWFLLEMIKILFLLEPLLLYNSLEVFKNKSKDIEKVFRFVGEVDMLISITSLRIGLDQYCIPELDSGTCKVSFHGLQHPLVPNCVANSMNSQKSVLLTGSNMSGKSTFIRAIGLNLISGWTLNTCFASTACIPKAKLFSVIRIEDDLMQSSSYFFQEINEIKTIIHATQNEACSIVLIDELFKGTNTLERVAAAKSILSYLNKQNCQIFVSTHDLELTTMLQEEFELYYFSETVTETSIDFDYKIKLGVPERGNAIRILQLNAYPESIVQEANQLVNKS